MLSLREVFNNERVQEGIGTNLFDTQARATLALVSTIETRKFNCISVKAIRRDEIVDFENTLWYSKDRDQYLLESRVFEENGAMINSYLEILNSNGRISGVYVDDVWELDWEIVKEEV